MPAHIVTCTQCGTDLDLSSFPVGQVVACPCGAQLTVQPPAVQPAPPLQQAPILQQSLQAPPPGTPPPIPPTGLSGGAVQQGIFPCKEASEALTFAIVGLFIFGIILGPIAIVKANKASKMIQADPRLQGAGKVTAAYIIGILIILAHVLLFVGVFASGLESGP